MLLILGKVARSVVTVAAVSGSEMKERWHTYSSDTMQTDIEIISSELVDHSFLTSVRFGQGLLTSSNSGCSVWV